MLFGVENDNTSLLTNSNNTLLANYEVTSAGSEVTVLPASRRFTIRIRILFLMVKYARLRLAYSHQIKHS